VADTAIDTGPGPAGPGADPGVADDPVRPTDLAPSWVGAAAGFRIEGADRVLLDRSGAPVARLVPAAPTPGSGMVDPGRGPDAATDRPGPAAPVPAPLVGPTAPELAGQWFPAGATNGAFLRFDEVGTWTGSDGCNQADGSWLVGTGGGFLATAPAVRTLMFCEGGADVATQADLARRAAFDGADLVLLDSDGAELGRYYRASQAGTGPATPPTSG
jgi:hypothetical protein